MLIVYLITADKASQVRNAIEFKVIGINKTLVNFHSIILLEFDFKIEKESKIFRKVGYTNHNVVGNNDKISVYFDFKIVKESRFFIKLEYANLKVVGINKI